MGHNRAQSAHSGPDDMRDVKNAIHVRYRDLKTVV